MSYNEIFSRNTLYWSEEFQNFLKNKYIAVIGLGGVGGYALEALCRLGISNFLIADFDTVSISNINRQIFALNSTLNLKKTEAAKKRLLDINPDINLEIRDDFLDEEDFPLLFETKPDFIVDAIDVVRSKIALLKYAKSYDIKVISSFGAGNRMDASRLHVTDISEIKSNDVFVKNVISKLKKYAGINSGIWTVWSSEHARNLKKIRNTEKIKKGNGSEIEITKITPASNAIVPAVSGLLSANKILEIFFLEFNEHIS
ncbi:MAG: tRNA threonylcarbamoyladenosine dehydratase [Candidatus Gastranaerophilales bacterium]|nr:tRNA threonylcarbamoyladenosine dehydratase [Candidatus Gastranaerophilales bacterium]